MEMRDRPSGNPSLQAHRTPHALRMRAACGEDSPHRRQNRRCVRRPISSILRGWCNANAKC